MPIYDYQCEACGHKFEEMQSFNDPLLVKCPACSKRKLRRLLGIPSLVFKGSGFYINDYKKQELPPVGD